MDEQVAWLSVNAVWLVQWLEKVKSESRAYENLRETLRVNIGEVRVYALWMAHTFKGLHEALSTTMQVTAASHDTHEHSRTSNHQLWNLLDKQVTLLTAASERSNATQLPQPVRDALTKYQLPFAKMQGVFAKVAASGAAVAKKYRDGAAGQLAKQMRVLDPRQLTSDATLDDFTLW